MRGLGWLAGGLLVLAACQGSGGDSGTGHPGAAGGGAGSGAAGSGGGPAGASGAAGAAGAAGQAAGSTGGAAAGGAGSAGAGVAGANGGAAGSQDKDAGSPDSNGNGSGADGPASETSGDAPYVNPLDSEVWRIDNLQSIGGHAVSKVLGAPKIIDTPAGKAVQLNGTSDALFVSAQPVAGYAKWTAEVIFRPDLGGAQAQRWFHMQAGGSDRVLFELRLNGDKWFLVSFVQSGNSYARAYAVGFPHAVGPWYHAAIVVDGASVKHYINGVYENAGPCSTPTVPTAEGCATTELLAAPYPLAYKPIGTGGTSLGCRYTQEAFMKGAIRVARFTPRALTPAEFMPLD